MSFLKYTTLRWYFLKRIGVAIYLIICSIKSTMRNFIEEAQSRLYASLRMSYLSITIQEKPYPSFVPYSSLFSFIRQLYRYLEGIGWIASVIQIPTSQTKVLVYPRRTSSFEATILFRRNSCKCQMGNVRTN